LSKLRSKTKPINYQNKVVETKPINCQN